MKQNEKMDCTAALNRRTFLKKSATTAFGAGLILPGLHAGAISQPRQTAEMSKRTLGRTGLEVTDISFGGIQIQQERLLDAAIDQGINLIHTSSSYGNGTSIRLFGQVMQRRRSEVFLALKEDPRGGIDDQLRILNTDYVDILVPPMHSVRSMQNPDLQEAFEKLKEEGKIRFSGYSCHNNTADVMNLSIELGFFDVMLVSYNLGNRDELDPILARAKEEQNMGFMVMKAVQGLDRDDSAAVASAFTSLLQNENVDTLLIGMASFSDVEKNVAVSGTSMGYRDHQRLRQYAHLSTTACAMCGACDTCSRGVAVGDILRYKRYTDRGERRLARSGYRGLAAERTVHNCNNCGDCERACPRSRSVLSELHAAHLSLA